jgi:phenylacetate-CoA ligase
MPLIRYRLGDRTVRGPESGCECGRNFPILEQIVGRMDDALVTPDGRLLGRLDPVFKGIKGICETQIIQTDVRTLEFHIVKGPGFREEDMRDLAYEIRKRTGGGMEIKIMFVESIPRHWNGKFQSVVSRIAEHRYSDHERERGGAR